MSVTIPVDVATDYSITFPISFKKYFTAVMSTGNVFVSSNVNDLTTTGVRYNMTCLKTQGTTTFTHGFLIAIGSI